MKDKRIGVIIGGLSAEREISIKSGEAVFNALVSLGYNAVKIDAASELPEKLKQLQIEVAFIALHGRYGEDGAVQGLLEIMNIPYTGSGVLASALAMDKIFSKKIFSSSGLKITDYFALKAGEVLTEKMLPFPFPVVVKPSKEGSSVGVTLVKSGDVLQQALDAAFSYDDEILTERYVKGKEIQVGILNEKALGAIEIVPKNEFYDFEAKYSDGMAEHIMPANIAHDKYEELLSLGEKAHKALGCSGYSRVDFILNDLGEAYILEVNTLPGMTSLSLLPEIAGYAGISFETLIEQILLTASLKIGNNLPEKQKNLS
ncbi:MAG: D-alanine--D-alanine ligase [Desulfuromonadales bacterium]|nr:D-alanine--D-alanine ligase [Desulfuromonadales bacterium]